MPLVRISLREGTAIAHRRAIADGVHRALVETFNVPADDRFQLIDEYPAERLIFDRSYLGIHRSDAFVAVEIVANNTRTVVQKQALYRRIAELLAEDPGLDPQDVFINLVEVAKENWSFGNGVAVRVTFVLSHFLRRTGFHFGGKCSGALSSATAAPAP